jgi:GNAT superfamily N-acetyltransferase
MNYSKNNIEEWAKRALESEIELSKGWGGKPIEYESFIHILNEIVPWSGDLNRAVGVKLTDFKSFEVIVKQVESLHTEKGIERPDRYDIAFPPLDEKVWSSFLSEKGFRLGTVIFFYSPALDKQLPSGFELFSPNVDEHLKWYEESVKIKGYYNEDDFKKLKLLELNFIKTFKPYWLMKQGKMIGSVYCANLGEYSRLFAVEIKEEFRGQGFGTLLMDSIRIEAGKAKSKYILIQTDEKVRKFYEKQGFKECARYSVIRLK